MSRFATTTLLAALVMVAAVLWIPSPAGWIVLGAVGAAYLVLVGLGVFWMRLGFFVPALCCGSPGGRRVALTFDDGPDPEATPALLDLLKTKGVPATFFCVGERAAAHPDLVRRIAREGHTVGNHSSRHAWWTNFLAGRRLHREVERAQETLGDILGAVPRYYRSPMGLTNPHLRRVLYRLALELVGWDVRPFDRGADSETVAARVLRRVRDGSIVVLHDGGARPEALTGAVDTIVRELRLRGYTFVGLDELHDPPEPGKDTP